MGDYNRALKFVLNNEGGFSNHPADKGGATMYGITEGTLKAAIAKGIVKPCDIRKLTLEEAGKIYKARYYDAAGCSLMPWPLDAILFDACVNHGVGGGVKLLQKTLNAMEKTTLATDGAYGAKTAAALKNSALSACASACYRIAWLTKFCDLREALYKSIVKNNPKQSVFLKGWLARLERNRRLA